ncbi:hypothetical protein BDV98DRAFT_565284 [Pterulicium gracile]|uniref:Uncharacterized protein n=1 Tax=Pterulicium gracile TaxID=1884261 RepID=A0A5C3QMK7_9AGAR|nr:hypothetical protein BDV98DRAFT_565284 [Pterula gracilis]
MWTAPLVLGRYSAFLQIMGVPAKRSESVAGPWRVHRLNRPGWRYASHICRRNGQSTIRPDPAREGRQREYVR